jgi:hypothetical protein
MSERKPSPPALPAACPWIMRFLPGLPPVTWLLIPPGSACPRSDHAWPVGPSPLRPVRVPPWLHVQTTIWLSLWKKSRFVNTEVGLRDWWVTWVRCDGAVWACRPPSLLGLSPDKIKAQPNSCAQRATTQSADRTGWRSPSLSGSPHVLARRLDGRLCPPRLLLPGRSRVPVGCAYVALSHGDQVRAWRRWRLMRTATAAAYTKPAGLGMTGANQAGKEEESGSAWTRVFRSVRTLPSSSRRTGPGLFLASVRRRCWTGDQSVCWLYACTGVGASLLTVSLNRTACGGSRRRANSLPECLVCEG